MEPGRHLLKHIVLALSIVCAAATVSGQQPAARWWSHVEFLASDAMRGRAAGTPEHRRAAEYVADQFRRAGLEPAGTSGYFQRVSFRSRRIVEDRSSLALVRADGRVDPVVLGDDATFSMRIEPAPQAEAPLVFAGYGLQVPEAKHDDLSGLDVRGKIVVLMTGGPSNIPGPLVAHYQSTRWEYLNRAGAIGVISIANPKGQDIPWDRAKLARFLPQMAIADPALDETRGQQVAITFNAARAETLFNGSGHTFADILALSNDGKILPRFVLPSRARVTVAIAAESIESDNVLGVRRGTDPVLRNEHVVLSAHLDHLGVGEPINGDSIYNGAMDNASGIATLIEAAASGGSFKRSVVFAAVTAEEKGLLGSRYLANRFPIAGGAIVANLNSDMFLPLFPLRSVIVQGLEESDLAADLARAAAPMGIAVLADPEPERNGFVRSDQYSFIKTGVPSLSLKLGFTKESPEHQVIRRWRAERYHAPGDDLAQPVDRKAAEDFGRLYLGVVAEVANRSSRPQWNPDSFFRRFAPVAAQNSQGTLYARIAYHKVALGREADFERIMRDEWKPLYRTQQQQRAVANWRLYRVHLTGTADEYNYVSVSYHDSWTSAQEPGAWHAAALRKTEGIAPAVRQALYARVDSVARQPAVPFKYAVMDFMKVKPGMVDEYLKVEREDWKPLHQVLTNEGNRAGWTLWDYSIPGGTGSSHDFVTTMLFDDYAKIKEANDAEAFKRAHPNGDLAASVARTRASRDVIRTEIWEVIDALN
jgi:Zn-dependent M28 family amino/carboxypeptidase